MFMKEPIIQPSTINCFIGDARIHAHRLADHLMLTNKADWDVITSLSPPLVRRLHQGKFSLNVAIVTVDAFIDPFSARARTRFLINIARKYNMTMLIVLTNPASLDAIDITDDSKRLWVYENVKGLHHCTRITEYAKRYVAMNKTEPINMPLSQAYIQGYLGGLNKQADWKGGEDPIFQFDDLDVMTT